EVFSDPYLAINRREIVMEFDFSRREKNARSRLEVIGVLPTKRRSNEHGRRSRVIDTRSVRPRVKIIQRTIVVGVVVTNRRVVAEIARGPFDAGGRAVAVERTRR